VSSQLTGPWICCARAASRKCCRRRASSAIHSSQHIEDVTCERTLSETVFRQPDT
jgi:hypothetical protein